MILHPSFAVEPWSLTETELDLDVLAQSESVFSLSNGHIGVRGNLDEGEPYGLPGTYLNAFYEQRPIPYPEGGYGFPEAGETIVNVANGKIIRLLVGDEPFDVRYGKLLTHRRRLDFRTGLLERTAEWQSPAGRKVRVSSTRLVSFAQRAVMAIAYEVEPIDAATNVVVQSELVANEPLPSQVGDPRAGAVLDSVLHSEHHGHDTLRAGLVHSTGTSRLRTAAAMDHIIDGPDPVQTNITTEPDLARLSIAAELQPGQRLRVLKLVAYGWSSQRSVPAMQDQVNGALAAARLRGWNRLVQDQRAHLDDFWHRADVEIEGDAEVQQAVRFGLFHVLQAAVRAESRAIPAKGLTGTGYDGHSFWDSESFVLPVLTYTAPTAAGDALRWRRTTLPQARDRARVLGLGGATFPWRTISGAECSGYWPAGTAAFHVNADIADAVVRYHAATRDDQFAVDVGLELLVETARLWRSLGHHDKDGSFRIDGVTGPDEYSAIADNNVYTNLMAQRNLRAAADAAGVHPDHARSLGVTAEEAATWRDAADRMVVPYDDELGVHPQAEGFTRHQRWDFAATREDQYPLLLHFPYFNLYRQQVVKQADLVLAMYLRGDAFTEEQKARNFVYYEPLTVRDSSLSASTQSIMAAEVGFLDLAYDYLGEAATMDLRDLEHDTRDGIHMAALAGSWLAVVSGLGGMRDHGGQLSFAPRLPGALSRVCFRLVFQGTVLMVDIKPQEVAYQILGGPALQLMHEGEALTVEPDNPVSRPVHLPRVSVQPPTQPPGRAPAPRRVATSPPTRVPSTGG